MVRRESRGSAVGGPTGEPAGREPSPSTTRFVVLAAPRTGSNWLCSLLDSHPAILCHHEIFNPERVLYAASCRGELDLGTVEERDADPGDFLARMWQHARAWPVAGFKINRGQEASIFDRVIPDPTIRKVLLRRDNRVKTYISERLAELTGEWESYPWSPWTQRERERARPRSVRLEVDQLKRHIALNESYFAELRARLARSGQEPFELSYEEIGDAERRQELLRFLGAHPSDVKLEGLTRKQTPKDLRDTVENFEEVAEALRGTALYEELVSREL